MKLVLLIHRLGGPPSPLGKARIRASDRKTVRLINPFLFGRSKPLPYGVIASDRKTDGQVKPLYSGVDEGAVIL